MISKIKLIILNALFEIHNFFMKFLLNSHFKLFLQLCETSKIVHETCPPYFLSLFKQNILIKLRENLTNLA